MKRASIGYTKLLCNVLRQKLMVVSQTPRQVLFLPLVTCAQRKRFSFTCYWLKTGALLNHRMTLY